MSLSRATSLSLRRATLADTERTFAWAIDPETRAASFHSGPIARAEHDAWLQCSLSGAERALLIAELDGAAVGVVRLDRGPDGRAEVGVTVAPERRGQGLSLLLIQAAVERARELGVRLLVARIRPTSERSLRSFARAGFRLAGRDEVAAQPALRYELPLEARGLRARCVQQPEKQK